jgi:hypothetical protein
VSESEDVFAAAADLIRDVGERSQAARRYRDLASVADAAFERALALGTTVRRARRAGTGALPEVAAAVAELQSLLGACENGLTRVRSSERYGTLVEAVRDERFERICELASAVFTDVTPHPGTRTVFWTLPLAGKRGQDHFLSAAECARRIRDFRADGIPAAAPAPDLGADDQVPAVVLLTDQDAAESPFALAMDTGQLRVPPCRLAGTPIVLAYGLRLRAPFRVWGAATSNDEWWATGGDTYPAYLRQLRAALEPSGIELDGALTNA